jgi:hypothetical protein
MRLGGPKETARSSVTLESPGDPSAGAFGRAVRRCTGSAFGVDSDRRAFARMGSTSFARSSLQSSFEVLSFSDVEWLSRAAETRQQPP